MGTRDEWRAPRLKLLDRENDLNRLRDQLAEERRALPWVPPADSCGLDPVNSAYQLLDLLPKGRHEDHLEWPMEWLRRHDSY